MKKKIANQLIKAVQRNDSMTLESILKKGVDPNLCPDKDMITALHCAVLDKNIGIIYLLLTYGADPTIQTIEGENAFDIAEKHNSREILELLKNYNKSIH